jgi:transmembrane 9 superfamily protein 2/4
MCAWQVYYVFGFLMLVVVIMVITCAEISIVMCYFQLCAEDYNWWWRSFLTSGSSAIYLFGYGILYFVTKVRLLPSPPPPPPPPLAAPCSTVP